MLPRSHAMQGRDVISENIAPTSLKPASMQLRRIPAAHHAAACRIESAVSSKLFPNS